MLTCSSEMTSAQSSRKMIFFFLVFSYIATDQSFPPINEPINTFELRQQLCVQMIRKGVGIISVLSGMEYFIQHQEC